MNFTDEQIAAAVALLRSLEAKKPRECWMVGNAEKRFLVPQYSQAEGESNLAEACKFGINGPYTLHYMREVLP